MVLTTWSKHLATNCSFSSNFLTSLFSCRVSIASCSAFSASEVNLLPFKCVITEASPWNPDSMSPGGIDRVTSSINPFSTVILMTNSCVAVYTFEGARSSTGTGNVRLTVKTGVRPKHQSQLCSSCFSSARPIIIKLNYRHCMFL